MVSKKLVLFLTLTIVFVGVLSVALKAHVVEASGSVYIRADGSVYPPTAPIFSADNVTYIFTSGFFAEVVVERDNIVVDGAGHFIEQGVGYGFYLNGIRNVTIKNTMIYSFSAGVFLRNSSHISILGNHMINTDWCIELTSSSNSNIIEGNEMENSHDGVWLTGGYNNKILDNTIRNSNFGVRIGASHENEILRNNITIGEWSGVYLAYSSDNIVHQNNIANYTRGICLENSPDNIITENNITNNNDGIWLRESSDNNFFHNNFINNSQQLYIWSAGYTNIWDNGTEGNYWDDYNGTDIDNDGVGETPYLIDSYNQDNYPLMEVIPEFPSAIILPLFIIATLLAVIVYKKRAKSDRFYRK